MVEASSRDLRLKNTANNRDCGIIKDTINVPKSTTVEVDFLANNAGLSLGHCHMQQHMDFGFKALVKYE